MKIKGDQPNSLRASGQFRVQGIRPGTSSSFEQELFERYDADSKLRLQETLKEINRLSERLSHSLTVNDLMLYKKMVKRFLAEATSRAYNIKQDQGRNRRGRSLLISVQTIDKEIEYLIQDFAANRKEPVEVLGTLDKIRGMLIDLMV